MSESSAFLLGAPPDTLVGTNVLDLLHPDDHELVIETMGEPARGAEDRIRVALRVRHADGHWTSLDFGGIDLREADGSGLFLVWGNPDEATGRLQRFLNALLAGNDLGALLQLVVDWHDTTTPGTRSAIFVRDGDGTYRSRAASAALPTPLAGALPTEVSAAAHDDPAVEGRPYRTLDAAELPEPLASAATAAGLHAVWTMAVAVPGTARPSALIVLWRTRPGPMLATHRRQLEHTAQVVRLAVQWSASQEELVTAATTDPLTGLANRAQLDAAIRADRSTLAAVLFVDLDDFKLVNDRHGHLVGDRLLQEAAERMARSVRADDLLVRLGGDEFAVWCPRLRSADDAAAVADRIVTALGRPVEVAGEDLRVGASVGLAVVASGDSWAGDVDRLLGAADQALYRAKRAGKARWIAAEGKNEPLPFPD